MDGPAAAGSSGSRLRDLTHHDDRSSAAFDAAAAICRICRGEGTASEPLFYPCKCSGSIKFVHQDCLMEWLSHSQKKYCELCKTPFRFTKLYAPDMPKSLPVHIFLEHMAKYLFQNILVWLRAAVAISVWVCWLPYFMRSVWSFMFWISDEGLGNGSMLSRKNEINNATAALAVSLLGIGTCPVTPLLAATTTSVAEAEAMIGRLAGEDISEFLVRILLGTLGMPSLFNQSDSTPYGSLNISSANANLTTTTATLLGNVSPLRNLTRSAAVNRAVISVLEGQIITVLVIVCFILVILVRDYVVQQQPEINMRAAFAAPENEIHLPAQADTVVDDVLDVLEMSDSDSDDETLDDGGQVNNPDWDTNSEINSPVEAAASVTRPSTPEPLAHSTTPHRQSLGEDGIFGPEPQSSNDNLTLSSTMDNTLDNTIDDAMESQAGVYDFASIYRLANADREEMSRITEERRLKSKQSPWLEVAHQSEDDYADKSAPEIYDTSVVPDIGQQASSASGGLNINQEAISITEGDDPQSRYAPLDASKTGGKGKDRAWLPDSASPGPSWMDEPRRDHSRPRAMSDGPQVHVSTNPLGNNSWTFAALPDSFVNNHRMDSIEMQDDNELSDMTSSALNSTLERRELEEPLLQRLDTINESEQTSGSQPASQPSPSQELIGPESANGPIADDDAAAVGLVDRVTNFMWGDLNDPHPAEPAVDEDHGEDEDEVQDDDPWVDLPMGQGADDGEDADAADNDGAPGGAGFDPEAIEDLEDFEGVMELIGMRGPIAGLFQNAIFCAVLVSVTIFACIFLPYNIGRVSVWILASPMRLVRMLFEISKLIQDASVLVGGFCSWCLLNILDIFTGLFGGDLAAQVVTVRKASWGLWTSAGTRVLGYMFMDFPISASEMQNFSAVSHEALITVKDNILSVIFRVDTGFSIIYRRNLSLTALVASISCTTKSAVEIFNKTSSLLMNPSSWVIDLSVPEERPSINPELAHWSGLDRFWAILAGYLTVFLIGAMYLKRGSPFSRGTMMHAWEAGIIDTLHQASGIMKVILIISIEMLVFPLYCGLLLDAALLPLFENASFKSRMLFTFNYPLTSVFVHWFVGTGYMFHFALFVSMCRKIMRPGVLYFIRDPDDPEFHPVRDVLERNLTTQLRKILFSAFVYGALVIVCLGGVVWGLSFTMPGVLPVHYSSNEPVLEFPVDLLFYNFFMPLAVKFLKPSDALHTMYTWWFRKCARALRLTYFLFGERRIDEEGLLYLPAEAEKPMLPHMGFFLEVGEDNNVIPKTWKDTFEGGEAKPNPPITSDEMRAMRHKKSHLVESGQLVKDGRFVRAPASDRVKIPKGRKVFITVTERGHRKDGITNDDLYASDQYQLVYVPLHFRTRIFLFILFIWLFAAITGVGFTIVPLVFGRRVFKVLIPSHIRTNDIYAFSIGIYVLGSVAYSIFHARKIRRKVQGWLRKAQTEVVEGNAGRRVAAVFLRVAKLCYAYFFLLIVFPLLTSTMMELYLTIPLHTYLHPPKALSTQAVGQQNGDTDRHTVRVIQAWTLGLLYLKLGSRMIISLFPDSRAAIAVRSVLRRGWLRPDVGVLTRAFVVPGLAASAVAIFAPPITASFLIKNGIYQEELSTNAETADDVRFAIVYRLSYPAMALAALFVKNIVGLAKVLNVWTARVRDEAYLIGERLHNFGAGAAGARKGKKAWGAGRARI